jgi:hypothetical protein
MLVQMGKSASFELWSSIELPWYHTVQNMKSWPKWAEANHANSQKRGPRQNTELVITATLFDITSYQVRPSAERQSSSHSSKGIVSPIIQRCVRSQADNSSISLLGGVLVMILLKSVWIYPVRCKDLLDTLQVFFPFLFRGYL